MEEQHTVLSHVESSAPDVSSVEEEAQQQTETARLMQCRKELDAYQVLSGTQQKGYKHTFEILMQEASRYSGIRSDVGGDTQEIVDALYRYRVNRLCAEIHQALLVRLAERAELAK